MFGINAEIANGFVACGDGGCGGDSGGGGGIDAEAEIEPVTELACDFGGVDLCCVVGSIKLSSFKILGDLAQGLAPPMLSAALAADIPMAAGKLAALRTPDRRR